MKEVIKKILQEAVFAPSGDNCQPWRFVFSNNELSIYNLPGRDTSLYSWGQRSSHFAHGALIENIRLLAPVYGLSVEIDLFPDKENTNLVAQIKFSRSNSLHVDILHKQIKKRVTNRKPYKKKEKLSLNQRRVIDSVRIDEGVSVVLLDNNNDVEDFCGYASVNERIVLENPYLHSFLFHHINWTKEEDEVTKTGFYIKTFEMPPPAEFVFRLARNWSVLRWLNKIGLSRIVSAQNKKIYSTSSAVGAVVIDQDTPRNYIYAGRTAQRLWLTFSGIGLSMQPITGIPFLMLKVKSGDVSEFECRHVEMVRNAYIGMTQLLGVDSKVIAWSFRLGVADRPSASALRLSPEIEEL